eukprot:1151945-Pelagomonas_calceolata.AAC.3
MHGVLRQSEAKTPTCELESQLWVPSRTCMHEHLQFSILLHASAAGHFWVIMSMQVSRELQEERLVPFFFGSGDWKEGFGGGW